MFDEGKLFANGEGGQKINAIAWKDHAKFAGVAMKTAMSGAQGGNRLGLTLVRIAPGCEIGEHIHAGKSETHCVLGGAGTANIGGKRIAYDRGTISYIEADLPHSVKAGEKGLELLAIFAPPLD